MFVKVLALVLLAGLIVLVKQSIADFKRYRRLSRM